MTFKQALQVRYLLSLLAGLSISVSQAQQLDMDDPGLKAGVSSKISKSSAAMPAASSAGAFYAGKPIAVRVSKTLYLPPAMYGQWSIMATLIAGNSDMFSTSTTDIWVLERSHDQVTVTNPTNGAMAVLSVTDVKDNKATIVRELSAPDGYQAQEIIEMSVNGDTLAGKDMRKIQKMRHGVPVQEYVGLYQFHAQRISGARTMFKPMDESGPDIEIEDIKKAQ